MKWVLHLMVLLFLIVPGEAGYGQAIIRGVVKDAKSIPVTGASISLRGSYDGATADSAGFFSFSTMEKGQFTLVATAMGYRAYEQSLQLGRSDTMEVIIQLRELVTELNAVILTAGTFEAGDRKRAAAVLDPIDIVTTASANGDITGALKTLPGAQQVGEREGLFVRGGSAGETRTFIDGTLVNNFFYSGAPNIAQFSRFSPFLFKGTVFSTGGYSALYGQAMSSALILESIDLPDKTSSSLGITILSGNAGYQHLAKNKKSSWGGSYGYTNLAPAFFLIKQKQDYSKIPAFHNADANFRVKTSTSGILKYYGYYSSSKLAFTTPSLDSAGYLDKFAIKNSNIYHNVSWKESLGNDWKVNAGISFTNNRDDITGQLQDGNKSDVLLEGLEYKNFQLETKGIYLNGKLVLERKLRALNMIRFGAEYNYSKDKTGYTRYNGESYPFNLTENIKAGFAEVDFYLSSVLAAKLGGRLEHSSVLNKTNFAPRTSIAYKLSKGTQVSLAYGIFYQNPETKYLPSTAELQFMKASHYIAQFQRMGSGQTFRTEIYYKRYKNLIKTGIVNNRETAIANSGFGSAKGIEFFWRDKKSIKEFDYWISYSFLDTKRNFLNFPFAITPNFAARHSGSIILKKFVQQLKMNLNGSYNFASGRPYYHIGFDGMDYKFNDRGKTPDYHNVSFSVNYLPSIGKKDAKNFVVYVLHVSNAFNFRQTYGYQYSTSGHRKEAIVPPSRMFLFIGAFFSFGVDRSDEVINNTM